MLQQFSLPLFTLLGVVIGSLLTGSLSIFNSYFQSVTLKEREKNKLILEKLEELFGTIELLRIYHKNSFLTYHRYLIRTENVPNAVSPDDNSPIAKILGLTSFYAPELKPKLVQLLQEISEISEFDKKVLANIKNKEEGQNEITQIMIVGETSIKKFNQVCVNMQEEITVLAKKYL